MHDKIVNEKIVRERAFSLIEVTIAFGILTFVAVVILGLLAIGLASTQRTSQTAVSSRLALQVQAELQQVGLEYFSSDTTKYDIEGRLVRDTNNSIVPGATTAPLYDVYRTVMGCALSGTSAGALQSVVVQIVKNPGQQTLSRSLNGLVAVPPGWEERCYQFHVISQQ